MDDNTQTDPRNVEDTWSNLANGSYPVSELLRRTAEHMKAFTTNMGRDPIGAAVPFVRPLGQAMKHASAFFPPGLSMTPQKKAALNYFSDPLGTAVPDPNVGPGRRYVDTTDKVLHQLMPTYIPRRDQTWEPPLPSGI